MERVEALGGGGTERGPLERGGGALCGVGVALRGVGVAPRDVDEGIGALGGGGAGGRGTLGGAATFGRLAIGLLKLGGGGGALPGPLSFLTPDSEGAVWSFVFLTSSSKTSRPDPLVSLIVGLSKFFGRGA